MKDSIMLRFLYGTVWGRLLLKLLVQPPVSKIAGVFLSSHLSAGLVPYYIKKWKINMKDVEIPEDGFSSFNDFFTRRKKVKYDNAKNDWLKSPCEGWMSFLKIRRNIVFNIKNTRFSLEDLLKDSKLAEKFRNGAALVFRLTPADYHRYYYGASGKVLCHRKIQGKLHCVRPVALRTVPVFAQNTREYEIIATKEFGTILQMEIGALLVGKIHNYERFWEPNEVEAGMEKGYFEFGGSTIMLLFQKDAVRLLEKLYARSNADGEIKVAAGEEIARAGCGEMHRVPVL